MKKTTFITTFSAKGYETHGKYWIESFIKNNQDVYAVILVDFDLNISNNRIKILNYNDVIPNHKNWIQSYVSLNINKEQEQYGIKFSYKAFVIMYAIEHLSEYVVWLDSDCVFKKNTYNSFAQKVLDNKFVAVQVDKNGQGAKWKNEDHVESGIILFDMEHEDKNKFLCKFKELYQSSNLANMEFPYDGFVIMKCCKEIDFVDLFPSDYTIKSLSPNDTFIHPEIKKRFIHQFGGDVRQIKSYKDLKGKNWYKEGIPKWMFRFGNESIENIHPKIFELYNKHIDENPEYELFYFDTKDRLEFVKDLNDPRIEYTYNKLIPPAFKCDFLKFVLLYEYGGIYMDFSMELLKPLKDIFKDYKRILAKDDPVPDGMCIGFITSEKGDKLMKECIERCIYNTFNNIYGATPLDITGPLMFSRIYKKVNNVDTIPIGKVSDELYFYNMADNLNIYDGDVDGTPIIKLRMENHHKIIYNHEWNEYSPNNLHYHILYQKGNVFKMDLHIINKIKTYKDLKNKVFSFKGVSKLIFRTSKFKLNDLPNEMLGIYLSEINNNSGYTLFYFDDEDCQSFMEDLGDERLLNAYNKLIPTAYKADLWRYSILRKYGGIYIDSTHRALIPYDEIIKDQKEIFVKDHFDKDGIYNAFMCTAPNNEILNKVIGFSIYNIENEIYGDSNMDIVSCNILRMSYNVVNNIPPYENIKIGGNIWHYEWHSEGGFIYNDDNIRVIKLKDFQNYYSIMYNTNDKIDNYPVSHYKNLWANKTVFKNERWLSINNLYKKILKREGDLEGLSHYCNGRSNIEEIEKELLESSEYKNNQND